MSAFLKPFEKNFYGAKTLGIEQYFKKNTVILWMGRHMIMSTFVRLSDETYFFDFSGTWKCSIELFSTS